MKHIHAASSSGRIIFSVLWVAAILQVACLIGFGRNIRLEARAVRFHILGTTHRQHRISQDFGFQSLRNLSPQIPIHWIDGLIVCSDLGGLLPDGAIDDQPVQTFDLPVV